MKIDAQKFNYIARTVFAPVYPVLAYQMFERTGLTEGVCLDIGSGGGCLGLAIARNSGFKVYLLDESADMCEIATGNIEQLLMKGRVVALCGSPHAIPLENGSIDLVVSRGSIYYWENMAQVLREIWRVLAPGGHVCIGGGFGSEAVMNEIILKMQVIDPDWQPMYHGFDDALFVDAIAAAKISGAEIIKDESGTWVTFQKPLELLSEG
ncbi:MAG: class I SAM-dependent methyltransferase [Desulfuromonadaceae bacterium]